tara:strand:- start:12903 stop:13682 length:780 start_codon:yes stop_codon:yes gene_type:complete
MPHISYSELKDWVHCAFYHKLTRIDKISGFTGNLYTAFGKALHTFCESKMLNEEIENDEEFFIDSFEESIDELDDTVTLDQKMIADMRTQGKQILPEVMKALNDYFGEWYLVGTEIPLMQPIEGHSDYKFKGFIDAIIMTPDGIVHIFDWKTCSWGWDSRRRTDKMTTYQLTLYKHFYAKKLNLDPEEVETHFALLKRTAKKERVEFFKVTSGERKVQNALELLNKAIVNIKRKRYIKNRSSCTGGFGCKFHQTEHCPL